MFNKKTILNVLAVLIILFFVIFGAILIIKGYILPGTISICTDGIIIALWYDEDNK